MGSDDRVDERERADIERRLRDGEWLKIGDLMKLFADPNGKPASRSSVDRWITNGARFGRKRIPIHYKTGPSGERLCDPRDIAAVFSESQKIRSSDYPEGIPE